MQIILLTLLVMWIACVLVIILSSRTLLKKTWQEPYLGVPVSVIESDDWGPGDSDAAEALQKLLSILSEHTDSCGRMAVLTANIVLTVPDVEAIKNNGCMYFERLILKNDFPFVYSTLMKGFREGLLLPQLHGKEHLYPPGFMILLRKKAPALIKWLENNNRLEWQSLPHQFQAHYVNGSYLPSRPIPYSEQQGMVREEKKLFYEHFGFDSISAVAPCFLWDDQTEMSWHQKGVRFIQTAGYRCTGLDEMGNYIQNPPIIRFGDRTRVGQMYLVRTVMYEPSDRKDAEIICWKGVVRAFRQCLPAVISTHAYNYYGKRSRLEESLSGLNKTLEKMCTSYPNLRFMNSPELGMAVENLQENFVHTLENKEIAIPKGNTFIKVRGFLYRLWYRHKKLKIVSTISLLIIPAIIVIAFCNIFGKTLLFEGRNS